MSVNSCESFMWRIIFCSYFCFMLCIYIMECFVCVLLDHNCNDYPLMYYLYLTLHLALPVTSYIQLVEWVLTAVVYEKTIRFNVTVSCLNKQIVGWLYIEPAFNIVILISEIQENKELIKQWLFHFINLNIMVSVIIYNNDILTLKVIEHLNFQKKTN